MARPGPPVNQVCRECGKFFPESEPQHSVNCCFNCGYENYSFLHCKKCNKRYHKEYFKDNILVESSDYLKPEIRNLWLCIMRSKEYCNECTLNIVNYVKAF